MTRTSNDHSAPLTGPAWRLDPERSSAEFRVPSYWGLATVHGRFERFHGSLGTDGRIEVTIDAASLRTGNPLRDRHLRSADFFDTDHHPRVSFRSTGLERTPDGGWRLHGQLLAAGHQLALDLMPTVDVAEDHLEIRVQTRVDQRRLGMTYTRFGIRTPATLTVHAYLRLDSGRNDPDAGELVPVT